MGIQEDFDALKRVHHAVNERVNMLETENNRLQQLNSILTAEKIQWEQQKVLQDEIIKQHLGNSDGATRALQDEIIELRERLKGK
jgi:hypothetical protein